MKVSGKKYCLPFLACLLACSSYGQLKDALKLKLTGNGYSDETVIRFLDGSTPGFDATCDAWKLFSPNTSVPSVFTKEINGKALCINAAGPLAGDISIPLFMIIPAKGNYTLNIYEIGKFPEQVEISLINLSSGAVETIGQDTVIMLSYDQSTRDTSLPQLAIRFSMKGITTGIQEEKPALTLERQNGGLLLKVSGGDQPDQILITDISGRTVENTRAEYGQPLSVPEGRLHTGIYVITVITTNKNRLNRTFFFRADK